MEIHKSFFYYESRKDDSEIEAAIRSKTKFDSDGFWKIYHLLRNEGRGWNHKRVYRVYRGMRFNRRVPLRRRLPVRVKNPLTIPECENIRCDNGPEFISHVFQDWCRGNGINIMYIQPGCPTQNSYIERFNGSYRRAVLDAYIFRTLDEVREVTDRWMDYYNNERPHDALDNVAPMKYRLARTG